MWAGAGRASSAILIFDDSTAEKPLPRAYLNVVTVRVKLLTNFLVVVVVLRRVLHTVKAAQTRCRVFDRRLLLQLYDH